MHVLLFFLILPLVESIKYERSFKLKRGPKEPAGGGRLKPFLKKVAHLKNVPTLPPIPTIRPHRLLLNNENLKFDPCKVVNLCVNGGSCISDGNGDYFCNCPKDYYGKTCQFFADSTYCFRNKCANNATCYSVSEPQEVINPELAEFVKKNDSSLKFPDVTVTIRYQCWCQFGFYGPFCEFSEKLRHCASETCSGHGIVDITASGDTSKCQCHCEPFYSGPNCETVSPCRDFECTNQGVCKLKPDGTPFCECPARVFSPGVGPVLIYGEQCEMMEIADAITKDASKCIPCAANFMKWYNCLVDSTKIRFPNEDGNALLSFLLGDCANPEANCTQKLETANCMNGGSCTVALEDVPPVASKIGRYFLVPKCICRDGFEGSLCERKIPGPCDETPEEKEGGIKKCVHGTCAFNRNTGLRCLCQVGWQGTKCDQRDPCHPNPCGDSLCVTVPDGSTAPKHICVCNLNQDVDSGSLKCVTPHNKICFHPETGTSFCENGGHCYPCESDTDDISLCNDVEQKRGFRCICPPGFVPPFCTQHADACTEHRCLHGGRCVLGNNPKTDYSCECKHEFTGTFCEKPPGACAIEGVETCVRGKCEEDSGRKRGFRCDCDKGWKGFDCEVQEQSDWILWIDNHYYWTYPTAFAVTVLPIFAVLFHIRNKNKTISAVERGMRYKDPKTPASSVQQNVTADEAEKPPTISNEMAPDEFTAVSPGDAPLPIPPTPTQQKVSADNTQKAFKTNSADSNEGIEQTAVGDTLTIKEVAVTQSGESGDAEKKGKTVSKSEKQAKNVADTQSGESGEAEKLAKTPSGDSSKKKQKAASKTNSGDSTKKIQKVFSRSISGDTESRKPKKGIKAIGKASGTGTKTSSGDTSKDRKVSKKSGKIVAKKLGTSSDGTSGKKKSKLRNKK
uniref:EGF-like domain-containing protein n=1 Tax=Panagrellus redivivus TaxID=6233 RepID=A0A7E4USD2_PANRE